MEKDLHKGLEEAAEKYAWSVWTNPMFLKEWNECKRDYIAGAELGYKEAIALAKEWLLVNGVFSRKTCGELKQYLADFEARMLKLWEDEK